MLLYLINVIHAHDFNFHIAHAVDSKIQFNENFHYFSCCTGCMHSWVTC